MTRLLEVVANLDAVPAGEVPLTIFARRPWTGDSLCLVLPEEAVDGGPAGSPDFEYFLEVDLAREVLEVWQQWRAGAVPSAEQATRAVIFYAEHDAYEPVAQEK